MLKVGIIATLRWTKNKSKSILGGGRVHGRAQVVLFRDKSELISADCRHRLQASAWPWGSLSRNRPSKLSKALLELPFSAEAAPPDH
jgi:hypothetical protein